MGGGSYSINSLTGKYDKSVRKARLFKSGIDYNSMSLHDTFKNRTIENNMNPHNISIRESRDSEEHPESVSIILGLDVTGSMGQIPHYLVKEGLPNIMGNTIQRGIQHPQMLFLAIGDHECDSYPLQVGQFESSDELLDKWLTQVYLEGGGGGNSGESYHLAWFFAANYTSIDCFEKRSKKGILFTIGDEPVLRELPKKSVQRIMGSDTIAEDYTASYLLDKAREKYNVYHLHLRQGCNGMNQDVIDGWKQLMGDNLIIVENMEDVSNKITECIGNTFKDIANNAITEEDNIGNDQIIL